MNQISDRLRGLVQSDIRRMSRECERVGGINLGQGICDLPSIPELVDGACDAIRSSKSTYSKFEGIDLLRERIAKKIETFNGFRVDPATEIVVTVGSTGGFAAAAMATLNAGDEVILFEPYYGYHLNTLKVLGIETKFVPLQLPDWSIDFDALRAAFGPKTRGIVVCTPSNPCSQSPRTPKTITSKTNWHTIKSIAKKIMPSLSSHDVLRNSTVTIKVPSATTGAK